MPHMEKMPEEQKLETILLSLDDLNGLRKDFTVLKNKSMMVIDFSP